MTFVNIRTMAEAAVSRRDQQRMETRARIYAAALAEFGRAGFARAQVDRIVAAAGVARGTFYFHFPTKEHVLLELQRDHEAAIVARLDAMPSPRSARELLCQLSDAFLGEIGEEVDPALLREILALYVRRPADLDLSDQPFPVVVEFARRLAEAANDGVLRSDIAPGELAGLLLTSLFGFVSTDTADTEGLRRRVDAVLSIFLRGISP
jgi:AcrR family transcriptional regulator